MSLLIGVPREVFPGEKRVATVPDVVEKLIKHGFRVAVEAGAGDAAQIADDAYRAAGAEIVSDRAQLWATSDIVFKVRGPDSGEVALLREGGMLVSFIWPAQNPDLLQALAARGCAAIHVSSGGVSPQQKIPVGPGYQVPFAQRVKAEVGLPTIAVGLITDPAQAEAIVANGEADAVSLARAMLYDPRWPWHAAAKLGARVDAPHQYWRSQPREFKDLFENAQFGAR